MSPEDPLGHGGESVRRLEEGPYSPSRGAIRRPRRWYLRRATVVGTLVVALVAVAVITDLPAPDTHAQKVSDAKGFLTATYGYLDTCDAGLSEAFSIASQVARKQLSPADLMRVPDLLRDDNLACSYTNDDVYQLASMTIPRALASSGQFATALLSWVVPDAYGATKAISVLASDPRNAAASTQLVHFDAQLTKDRASAERALENMERQLATSLPRLPLFQVPPGPPPLVGP
jgi:hypothetical protein